MQAITKMHLDVEILHLYDSDTVRL